MPRNLDRRVELVFPVEDPDLKQRGFDILDLMLRDNINARRMLCNKEYEHIDRRGKAPCNCQIEFSKLAQQAVQELEKQDQDKPLTPLFSPRTAES